MSALLEEDFSSSVTSEIQLCSAWLGMISGLKAEKMLRGKNVPYLYVLRAGESENNFYVTFIHPNMTIVHQPFVITEASEGWSFEQGGIAGPFPYNQVTLEDVLHRIMHCEKGQCSPLINS